MWCQGLNLDCAHGKEDTLPVSYLSTRDPFSFSFFKVRTDNSKSACEVVGVAWERELGPFPK